MWTYKQSTGELLNPEGEPFTQFCYSGKAEGKNNPDTQDRMSIGPVPRGLYTIGPVFDTQQHGPHVMRLTPDNTNVMFGRAGFLIHGDNPTHTASEGCIIAPLIYRMKISASQDRRLQVIR